MHKLNIPEELRQQRTGSVAVEEAKFDRLILEDIPATDVLETSLEINRARFYLHTLNHCLSPGRLLDTDAKNGLRMLGFKNEGWQVEGLEINPEIAKLSDNASGLEVHNLPISVFETSRHYDLVIASNIAVDTGTSNELAIKLATLVATDGYLLVEHNKPVFSTQDHHELNTHELLAKTDNLLNGQGFARINWGRPRKETKAEHLKKALLDAQSSGTLTRILAQPLRLLPNEMELSIPEFGSLWSLYQKV